MTPPPAGPAKSRKPLIIAGAGGVLAIIIAVVLILVLSGRGANSPEQAVKDYITAAQKGDVDAMEDAVCAARKPEMEKFKTELSRPGNASENGNAMITYQVGQATVNGDSATVPLTATIPSDLGQPTSNTTNVTVVKEGGSWKVC